RMVERHEIHPLAAGEGLRQRGEIGEIAIAKGRAHGAVRRDLVALGAARDQDQIARRHAARQQIVYDLARGPARSAGDNDLHARALLSPLTDLGRLTTPTRWVRKAPPWS